MKQQSRLLALLCPALLVLAFGSSRATAQEKFTPHHVAKLRAVTAAEVAPDGKQVAYVLSVPRDLEKEKDGRAWAELHVVSAEGKSRPFVAGKVNVSAVAWTPDGSGISFLAKRDGDEHTSLYTIPVSGGEARKVLEFTTNVGGYSWAPDGKRVAFLATEPESKEEKGLKEKGFTQEIYEEDVKFTRVWIADVTADKPEPRKLDLPGSASDLHWAPKGERLAVALAPTPLVDANYMFRKMRVVDPQTGKITAELDNPGKLGDIAWSPDGEHLAIVSGVDAHDPREGRLWVVPAAGGDWRDLTPDHKGHVESIAWASPGEVAYVSDDGVWTSFNRVKADGTGRQTILPTGGPILHGVSASADGKTFAFTGDTPRHPPEVFLLQEGKEPRRLTDSNAWLKGMAFAKQEVVRHKARDGLELEGILVRPLNEEKGKRYPLVLTVHGGPESHVPNGWVTTYSQLGQVGAANGFVVFYPNYRGSTGRGLAFSKMGQEAAAGPEFDDLVDAVDHLIKLGLVDKDKVGITGGSYGGYATAWGATYYSDRFAAGVMFVGISDVVSKTGTTDIPYEMYLVHHMKWLWQDWEYFLKASPIRYVERAKTPLLILHGKEDPRVHPGQSLELYRHLKVRGEAPVRLVLYPGEGHGNRRAASRLDYNLRLLRWMEAFLVKGAKKAPPMEVDYGLQKEEKK